MTQLDKAGSGSVRGEDHNAVVDALGRSAPPTLPSATFVEQAGPDTPPPGSDALFFDSADGLPKYVDDQGVVNAIGGSLPAGWTEEGDPANVRTDGGALLLSPAAEELTEGVLLQVGSTVGTDGNVQIERRGVTLTDGDDGSARIFLRGTATDQPFEIRARPGTDCILIVDGDDANSAIDCGDGVIINVGEPQNGSDGARLDSLGAMATYAGKPEIPATPTEQDIVDALVALGLVTQAAP